MEDRFAIIKGDFKSQTLIGAIFGIITDVVGVANQLYAEVHQTELIISVKEGGIIVPEMDFVKIPYEVACDGEVIFLASDEDRERMCLLEMGGKLFLYGLIAIIV